MCWFVYVVYWVIVMDVLICMIGGLLLNGGVYRKWLIMLVLNSR